ncbi:MAG: hypothetical protein ACYC5N_04860 [Endomicrobiales bacterium]
MINILIASIIICTACSVAPAADGIGMNAYAVLLERPYTKGPYVELTIEDGQGQRAGYGRSPGKEAGGLEQVCYVEEGTGREPRTKALMLMEPAEGSYTLSVTGTGSGIYLVEAGFVAHNEFTRTSVSGIIGRGEVQRAEILFNGPRGNTGARKEVDVDLLMREVKIAARNGMLEKETARALVSGFLKARRALKHRSPDEARKAVQGIKALLSEESAKPALKDAESVRRWFLDVFSRTPRSIREVLSKKEQYFSKIENIRPEMRAEWCRLQALRILLGDTRLLEARLKELPAAPSP